MDPRDPAADKALRAVLLALLAVLVLRTAWVGDDAYVTLRTIDHFVHGRGLVYNAGERAQAFTHPLWLGLLTLVYAVLRHPWWTAVLAGAATTLFASARLARLVPPGAAPLLVALPLSRAYVDYGTSGLENPLSHVLVVALCAAWLGTRDPVERLSRVALCTGLLGLTRLDLLVLAAPCLAAAAWAARWDLSPRDLVRRVFVGLSPLVAWQGFALVYYGAVLPTSVLAKLNTGLPAGALAKQGMLYVLFQAEWDPGTLLVLVAGTIVPFAVRDRAALPLAIGNVLYVATVVRVGGDFMGGRFFTAPMVVGLVLLARAPLEGARAWGAAAVLLALSLASPASTLQPQSDVAYGKLNDRGIVDERLYYVSRGGDIGHLRNNSDDPVQQWRSWATREGPTHVQVDEPAGYPAFYAHPGVRWICRYGITDPLLARLPPIRKLNWRVGHYERKIPEGYLESIHRDENVISDPEVAKLYDEIHHVTADPLWSWPRLRAIWRLHTGWVDIDPGPWRYPRAVVLRAVARPSGSDDLDAPGVSKVLETGAVLHFPAVVHGSGLDFRRREDVPFEIVYEREHREVARQWLFDLPPRAKRLAWARVDVPRRAVRGGYDTVRVLPGGGEPPWSVQYLGPAED